MLKYRNASMETEIQKRKYRNGNTEMEVWKRKYRNGNTETEVQKRKYRSEKKRRLSVLVPHGLQLTTVPCSQRVTISKICESQVLIMGLQQTLTQSFSMTR